MESKIEPWVWDTRLDNPTPEKALRLLMLKLVLALPTEYVLDAIRQKGLIDAKEYREGKRLPRLPRLPDGTVVSR